MTTADRLHYSRDHWERHFNNCLKNSVTYEGRVHRGEICTPERAAFVMASARDRIFHAYVMGCKMSNDPLRIAGVSFGVMLDDAKRELAQAIEERAKECQRVEDLRAAVTDLYFRPRSTQLNARRFLGIDYGSGRDHAIAGRVFYQPTRRAGKTASLDKLSPGGVPINSMAEEEIDDERFALYDAVLAIRKRNGYYDPWYLKAWKKLKARI